MKTAIITLGLGVIALGLLGQSALACGYWGGWSGGCCYHPQYWGGWNGCYAHCYPGWGQGQFDNNGWSGLPDNSNANGNYNTNGQSQSQTVIVVPSLSSLLNSAFNPQTTQQPQTHQGYGPN